MNPRTGDSTRKWLRAEVDEVLAARGHGDDALEHEVDELRPWFLRTPVAEPSDAPLAQSR